LSCLRLLLRLVIDGIDVFKFVVVDEDIVDGCVSVIDANEVERLVELCVDDWDDERLTVVDVDPPLFVDVE
jgi:hypothetical protein